MIIERLLIPTVGIDDDDATSKSKGDIMGLIMSNFDPPIGLVSRSISFGGN
jgi:hypothetical protein